MRPQVYCLDLVMSSGEGKPRETEIRTAVYKRALENSYTLKTQKARQFLAEVPAAAAELRTRPAYNLGGWG